MLYVGKNHCYLATKPEVEGFRDQGFVLPEVESLEFRILWLLKSFSNPQGRSQTIARHAFIFMLLYSCFVCVLVLARSVVVCLIHIAVILYVVY